MDRRYVIGRKNEYGSSTKKCPGINALKSSRSVERGKIGGEIIMASIKHSIVDNSSKLAKLPLQILTRGPFTSFT